MKKLTKAFALVIVVVLTAAVGLHIWSKNGQEKITQTADQFKVPEGWVLVSQDMEPPRVLCLGGNGCPSLRRRWNVPGKMSTIELMALIDSSGWRLTLEHECEPQPNQAIIGNGNFERISCTANGHVNGYSTRISYSTRDDKPADTELFLSLTSRGT